MLWSSLSSGVSNSTLPYMGPSQLQPLPPLFVPQICWVVSVKKVTQNIQKKCPFAKNAENLKNVELENPENKFFI